MAGLSGRARECEHASWACRTPHAVAVPGFLVPGARGEHPSIVVTRQKDLEPCSGGICHRLCGPDQRELLCSTRLGGAAARRRACRRHRAVPICTLRFVLVCRGYSWIQLHERCDSLRRYGVHGSRTGTSCATVPDSQRIVASLHRAADVLPLDDMDRGTLGGNISGVDMVAGYLVSAHRNDPRRA